MKELFLSQGFISFVIDLLFVLVVYAIVKLVTIRSGVDDLLNHSDRRIQRLRVIVKKMHDLCNSNNPERDVHKCSKGLKHVIREQKRASKALNMYLFDDREDKDVAAAKEIVDSVPDKCRKAIVVITDNKRDDMDKIFNGIDVDLESASALLKKALVIDKKKELLRLE